MPSPSHPAASLAAASSAAAGVIHAAAAGSHAELDTLSRLFAVAAVAQLAVAAALVLRHRVSTALAAIAVNLGVLGAWMVTRATGVSFVDGLEEAQSVGLQDAMAAALAVLAAVSAALSLSAGPVPRQVRVVVPALIGALVVATIPAMAQPHDHGDHSHDEVATGDLTADHSHAGDAADDHAHDEAAPPDAGTPDHHDTAATPLTDEQLGYPASFASFLEQAETPKARLRAEQLLVDTNEAMKAFPDEAAVQAAGYVSIGDGATGWEHYIHVGHILDPGVLDPAKIESIVLRVEPDGTKEVASAMYLMPFDTTMDDVPEIAGELTEWHDHQNLCWEGVRVVGTTNATGSCQRGQFRPTQPMLHVWVTEHPCGPFAGIEGSHGEGCAHTHEG
jgi:hypothetical protein